MLSSGQASTSNFLSRCPMRTTLLVTIPDEVVSNKSLKTHRDIAALRSVLLGDFPLPRRSVNQSAGKCDRLGDIVWSIIHCQTHTHSCRLNKHCYFNPPLPFLVPNRSQRHNTRKIINFLIHAAEGLLIDVSGYREVYHQFNRTSACRWSRL